MEKIKLDLQEGRLQISIGIPEERFDAMVDMVKRILYNARENGIMSDAVDEDGDLGTQINGIKFLEMLVNDVAQTEQERIYLCVMFNDYLGAIRPKNPLEHILSQLGK